MSVKRRLTNMFMVLVMLSSLAFVGAIPERLLPNSVETQVVQAAPAGSVKLGDYIQFGSYNNAPILWRVINIDANGDPVLFADRILTIKAFDAAGSYHPVGDRRDDGSNYYEDSNIRQWLNSSSPNSGGNVINWVQNDPTAANMYNGYNPYDTEKGFLADGNFSATERSLIKPLTHKVLLAGVDQEKKNGGTVEHDYYGDTDLSNVMQNYDSTAYFKNVTDSVFQLSIKQLKEWVYDRGYAVTAQPTAEAVTQSAYKNETLLNSSINWNYWLNSPDALMPNNVRTVYTDGAVGNGTAYSGLMGVRPALQLNLSAVFFASGGTGTSSSPYTLTTEAPVKPVYQSLVLSSNAKQLTATFDISLSSSDSTKITIKNGTTTALSNTAFNTSVSQKSLVITLANSKATFKAGAKITIGAGAVTASSGGSNDVVDEKTLDNTKFVRLSGTTMNSFNTEATLTLATTGKNGSLGSIALNPTLSNLSGQVETSVNDGKTWSSTNIDSATLVDSTVKVTFKTAVTNSKTIVRVKAGALSFTATGKTNGNLNAEVKSAALDLCPVGVSASLSADNKVVSIKYSETITNAVDTTKGSTTELKKKISFAADGEAFSAVSTNVTAISVVKDSIVISFAAGLTGGLNKLKIDAGALQDAKKNKAGTFTTEMIVADGVGPYPTGVGFKASDKTLTVFFNENIALYGSTDLITLASALKYNDTETFSNATVTISKNTLVITHNTPAITTSGNVMKINIPKELLKDAASNPNDDLETSAADSAAPVAVSHALSNMGKDITITFDEKINSIAKSVPLGSISITTGSGLTAVTKPLADAKWKTSTTAVTINEYTLKISNLKSALTNGNLVTIKANSIQDGQLNKNASAITTTVDAVAPTLTGLAASDITTISAMLNFNASDQVPHRPRARFTP